MEIFLFWIILSVVVGIFGSHRNIGFVGAFLLSLLLSPLIGFIITMLSKNIKEEKYKKELLKNQKQQQEELSHLNDSVKKIIITDELLKLKEMLNDGTLTKDEFQVAKGRLLNDFRNDDTKKHDTESKVLETIEQNKTNKSADKLQTEETVVTNNSLLKNLKFKYFVLAILIVLILFLINTIYTPEYPSNKIVTTSKVSSKPSNANISKIKIEGTWIPTPDTGYTIIDNIIIKRVDDSHYNCVLVLIDNSRKTEKLLLYSNGEYHANNKHGEYYKLLGDKLGSYDRDGLIETYYKSN